MFSYPLSIPKAQICHAQKCLLGEVMFTQCSSIEEAAKYVHAKIPEGGFKRTGDRFRSSERENGNPGVSYKYTDVEFFIKNHSTKDGVRSAAVYFDGRASPHPQQARSGADPTQQARSGADPTQQARSGAEPTPEDEETRKKSLQEARAVYEGWCTPNVELSAYAQKKGIVEALKGTQIKYNAKTYGNGEADYHGALVAPVFNGFSTTVPSTYRIYLPDGGKRSLVQGLGTPYAPVTYVHIVPPAAREKRKLIICEGLSTAASVAAAVKTRKDARDICVVTSHGASHISNVCRAAALTSWVSDIFVFGDNPDGNKDVLVSYMEAVSIGANLYYPKDKPSNYDYNDMHMDDGIGAVCIAVADALQTSYLREDNNFPMDCLPTKIKHVVEEVRKMTGADIGLVLQSVLSACALAVQGVADIQSNTVPRDLTSLFLITIAEFNEQKSTVEKFVLKPFFAHDKEQAIKYRNEKRNYERTIKNHDKKRAEIKQKYKGADGQTKYNERKTMLEHELELLEEESPREPSRYRALVQSGSMQGIGRMFVRNKSIGLMTSESGQFVGGYGMNKENAMNTIAALNILYSDGTYDNTVLKDGDETTVTDVRMTMHLQLQSSVYSRLSLNVDTENLGFLGRCLTYRVHRESNESFKITQEMKDAHKHHPALDHFHAEIRALHATHIKRLEALYDYFDSLDECVDITDAITMAPELYTLYRLSDEADEVFEWFYNMFQDQTNPFDDWHPIRGMISKMPQNARRIAVILHIFENGKADDTSSDDDADLIVQERTMYNACRICMYYIRQLLRERGVQEEERESKDSKEVMALIRRRIERNLENHGHAHTTQREIIQGKRMPKEELNQLIDMLERCGNIIVTRVNKGKNTQCIITLPK